MALLQRLRKPGAVIGGYTVIKVLGRGGSGDVYKVSNEAGEEYALKLVDTVNDDAARTRLQREVHALLSLRHDAVPQVIDAETEGEETFAVFELVRGDSLANAIVENGPLEGEELADLAQTLASALEAAHNAGVIHRDVTPSNVMMGEKGPKLIDFGLSHRTDDPRLTRDGLVSGTAGYVAPEVIDGAEPGPDADLWSWAATVAYAMLGDSPFGSGQGALGRTLAGEVTLPDVPGAEAVAAALSLNIAARPEPREVIAALRGQTEVLETGEEPPSVPGPALSSTLPVSRIFDLVDEEYEAEHAEEWAAKGPPLPPVAARRTGVLAAFGGLSVAAATVAPSLAFLSVVMLAALVRTEHRRIATVAGMRARRGVRRGDTAWATVGLPGH